MSIEITNSLDLAGVYATAAGVKSTFGGSGLLGNVTISSNTSLSGVLDYNNLTIDTGIVATVPNFRSLHIKCKGDFNCNGKINGSNYSPGGSGGIGNNYTAQPGQAGRGWNCASAGGAGGGGGGSALANYVGGTGGAGGPRELKYPTRECLVGARFTLAPYSAPSGDSVVTLDTEDIDTDSLFASNKLTITEDTAGIWDLKGTVASSTPSTVSAKLRLNGTTTLATGAAFSGGLAAKVSCVVELKKDDYIELIVNSSSTNTICEGPRLDARRVLSLGEITTIGGSGADQGSLVGTAGGSVVSMHSNFGFLRDIEAPVGWSDLLKPGASGGGGGAGAANGTLRSGPSNGNGGGGGSGGNVVIVEVAGNLIIGTDPNAGITTSGVNGSVGANGTSGYGGGGGGGGGGAGSLVVIWAGGSSNAGTTIGGNVNGKITCSAGTGGAGGVNGSLIGGAGGGGEASGYFRVLRTGQ